MCVAHFLGNSLYKTRISVFFLHLTCFFLVLETVVFDKKILKLLGR